MTPDTADRPVPLASATELDEFVATHERALVEFHTDGCSKCAAMEPVLDGVAKTTDAAVATTNPRDDPGLVETYDVRSVPKLLLFEGGDLVATLAEGFVGVDEVRAFVESRGRDGSDADGDSDATTEGDADGDSDATTEGGADGDSDAAAHSASSS